MTDTIIVYLPWILSAVTIYMNIMAGNKHPWAWSVGLLGQAGWLLWILISGNFGFLPMNAALWIVYGRNHWKWNAQNGGDGCDVHCSNS